MLTWEQALPHSPRIRKLLAALAVDATVISALLAWNAVDRICHHEWPKPGI